MKRRTSLAALLLAFYSASAQAQRPQVHLSLDGRAFGTFPALMSDGTLRLPLSAFASLGWRPLLDP